MSRFSYTYTVNFPYVEARRSFTWKDETSNRKRKKTKTVRHYYGGFNRCTHEEARASAHKEANEWLIECKRLGRPPEVGP